MVAIVWRNTMNGPPICDNLRSCPKRNVVWLGSVWLTMPDGACHTRTWRSNGKISRSDAQRVLHAVLDQLILEFGSDKAVDSGFTLKSR